MLVQLMSSVQSAPMSLYDLMFSDSKLFADVATYYFGDNERTEKRLRKRDHTNVVSSGRCMLPPRKGYCRALIPRYK